MREKEEEVVNATTHLFAAFFTFFITVLLIVKTSDISSLPIFILGATSSWTFFSSFLYHSSFSEPRRSRNRNLDISGIYIMIAGSGVSICLASNFSFISIVACFLIFLIAYTLIIKFCISRKTSESFLVSSCVFLGWLSMIPMSGIFVDNNFAGNNSVLLLLAGGVFYSLGVVFYVRDTKKWYHTAWHICVMIGFSFHYVAECIALGLI